MLHSLWQDLRFALRSYRRTPGVVALAVVTLALGVGANTAVFSVVDGVLLRPLPYPEPDRIGHVWLDNPKKGVHQGLTSLENYRDWRSQNESFQDLAAYVARDGGGVRFDGGEPELVRGAAVSSNFFAALGVAPLLGRAFEPEEEERGRGRAVVLGYDLWQSRFGGDPNVLGRSVHFDMEYTVVGVMPNGFEFPKGAKMWFPATLRTYGAKSFRANVWLSVVGRLKPGVTWERARAEMAAIGERLAAEYPVENEGTSVSVVPLEEQIAGPARQPLFLLWGAVAVVLLIACANVANLMLTRGASRTREVAVRIAIGAGRGRIVRQMLAESAVLAISGGALGLALAYWAVGLLVAASPSFVPRLDEVGVDGRVLGFSVAASAATVFLFGLAPALLVSHVDPQEALRSSGRAGGGGRGNRFRRALAAAEIAMSLVLLVAAGLTLRSLHKLSTYDLGFDVDRLVTLSVNPSDGRADTPEASAAYFGEIEDRIRALPGVSSVAATSSVLLDPVGRQQMSDRFLLEGVPPEEQPQNQHLAIDEVTPGYFATIGRPVLLGGEFADGDSDEGDSPPIVVNATMARRYWPDQDPIGKRFKFNDPNFASPWFAVKGVVADMVRQGPGVPSDPEAYVCYHSARQIVVRTDGDPAALVGPVRGAAREVDEGAYVPPVQTMADVVDKDLAERRLVARLLGAFAAVALAIAAAGVFGVMSYLVSQRTNEIGVRLALGARPADIVRAVLAESTLVTIAGLAVGLAGAFGVARLLESMLFEISPLDPATYVAITAGLALVATAASYVPARAASRVDAMEALRSE